MISWETGASIAILFAKITEFIAPRGAPALPMPKRPEPPEVARALLAMRRIFATAGAFSFCINVLMLAPSLYMMQIYDRVLMSRNGMTLFMLTLIILGVYLLLGLIEWVRSQLLIRAGIELDDRLGDRAFTAAYAARRCAARAATWRRRWADLNHLRQFLTGNGLFAFFDAPWTPLYLLVITLLHPLLGSAAAGRRPAAAGPELSQRARHPHAAGRGQPLRASRRRASPTTSCATPRPSRPWACCPTCGAAGRRCTAAACALQQLASNRAGSIGAATRFTRIALQSLILCAGALLVIDDQMSGGSMIAASILMGRALAPVEQAIAAWKHLCRRARSAYGRLNTLLAAVPAAAGRMSLPRPRGRLSVESAHACPPNAQTPVVKNVSFAPVARRGAGRDRAQRLGQVDTGAAAGGRVALRLGQGVRLDGADVAAWDKQEAGPWLGYLPQDVELLEGTIAENIARFAEVDLDKVVRPAARGRARHDPAFSARLRHPHRAGRRFPVGRPAPAHRPCARRLRRSGADRAGRAQFQSRRCGRARAGPAPSTS